MVKQGAAAVKSVEEQYAETIDKVKRHLDGLNKLVESLAAQLKEQKS